MNLKHKINCVIFPVQGTVISSEFHSENGQEPVGQISVTKYSSDPKDFEKNDEITKKGITSITTTQKFGYKDTPSLKTLTSSQKVSNFYEMFFKFTQNPKNCFRKLLVTNPRIPKQPR